VASAAALALAGCGGGDDTETAGDGRQVTASLIATEFQFRAEPLDLVAGDTVTFDVRNDGQLEHELQVLDDGGTRLGRTERIPPGARRSVTITFDQAGVYQVICDIDDHLTRGQRAPFAVAERP